MSNLTHNGLNKTLFSEQNKYRLTKAQVDKAIEAVQYFQNYKVEMLKVEGTELEKILDEMKGKGEQDSFLYNIVRDKYAQNREALLAVSIECNELKQALEDSLKAPMVR